MRKLLLAAIVATAFASCADADKTTSAETTVASTAAAADTAALTSIAWEKTQLDFGKIPEGQKLDIVYDFTNSGQAPLVIKRVEPGCGCTVAEAPTAPVAPGKKGSIKASFDSNGRAGVQHKSIYVYSNAKGEPQELVFTVEVTKKG